MFLTGSDGAVLICQIFLERDECRFRCSNGVAICTQRSARSPQILDIFKQIKNIFDPKNIFNPGKKVAMGEGQGGTREYIVSHLAIEHSAKHGV